jgi:DNA-binding transcriptional LysR family regulator
MRLTLRQLLIFTAIADTGSTTAAGQRLALSQSATSGALNELENLLGAQLFDRVGKRLLVLETTLPRLTRRLYLIHHRRKRFSANLQRFVTHCVDQNA